MGYILSPNVKIWVWTWGDGPQEVENSKKRLCNIFREMGLKITVEANKKVVNFLDVTLDLSRDIYSPYIKPNNPLLYVKKDSNHPPSIIKNIPE